MPTPQNAKTITKPSKIRKLNMLVPLLPDIRRYDRAHQKHTQAQPAMKAEPNRSRRMWQTGFLSCLMTLALGSAAQTTLRWNNPQAASPAPVVQSTTIASVAPQRHAMAPNALPL